jgi:hypothetical protein
MRLVADLLVLRIIENARISSPQIRRQITPLVRNRTNLPGPRRAAIAPPGVLQTRRALEIGLVTIVQIASGVRLPVTHLKLNAHAFAIRNHVVIIVISAPYSHDSHLIPS